MPNVRSETTTAAPGPEQGPAEGPAAPPVVAEVLVEDVSIDGMCGVY